MKGEDKYFWPGMVAMLVAMIANAIIVDIRVKQEVQCDWSYTLAGYLVIIFATWGCLGLFMPNRPNGLLILLYGFLGVIGMHSLFGRFHSFVQGRGLAYQAGDWFNGSRNETTVSIEDHVQYYIRYYRTHLPEGTLAGTVLMLIQWAELQFIVISVIGGISIATSRLRTRKW